MAMQKRIIADPTTPNYGIHELCQQGVELVFRTAWWVSERI